MPSYVEILAQMIMLVSCSSLTSSATSEQTVAWTREIPFADPEHQRIFLAAEAAAARLSDDTATDYDNTESASDNADSTDAASVDTADNVTHKPAVHQGTINDNGQGETLPTPSNRRRNRPRKNRRRNRVGAVPQNAVSPTVVRGGTINAPLYPLVKPLEYTPGQLEVKLPISVKRVYIKLKARGSVK